MTKKSNFEDLSEEELEELINKEETDNLEADPTDDQEEDINSDDAIVYQDKEEVFSVDEADTKPVSDNNSSIREEIEVKPESLRKKEKRLETKEAKQLRKAQEKMVKKHRKAIKRHPEKLIRYNTDAEKGLPDDVVQKRIMDDLVNDSKNRTSRSIASIVFTNVVTFFNILTISIAVILISVRAYTDLVFLSIVTANMVIGIIQEIRAKKTIDRLSLISAPTAIVRRDGKNHEIAVKEVVLDDLLLLDNGKQICADSIVVDGQIEVNESLLTGESDAIVKKPGDTLLSGSFVVSGKCCARVDKIGKDNYIEQLSSQAKKYKKPKSDLLFSLTWIIRVMAILIIPIGLLLFYIMYFRNSIDLVTSVRKTAGAMIGMIPSGLFLMTSIALAVGVIRLAQKNVLVQELYCIEMLARVNCICLDKTGTITDGTMSVKNVIDYNTIYGLATKNIVSAMLNALQDNNLTSVALKEKFGLGKRIKHIAAIPFSSQRKYQAVTFDKYGTFILGAPEFVLKEQFSLIKNDVNKYAALGYRVLCLAHKEGTIKEGALPDSSIEVVSMILIEDNIRPDAINTIKYFKDSGVSVRVISGDNPLTVSKISQRAGVDGSENFISLDGLSDSEVVKAATKYTVFGRVSPAQKKLLVETLKAAGMTVAMTGDGVNDILALKEADCSIAVASGSEAARNISHLVLLDSNFDSMPSVVSEGRRVINNVTSVAALFLTKTIFSLLLAIQTLTTGTYPISTNQLFLIDTLSIGLPSLVLVMEPNNNMVDGRFLPNVIRKALPGAIVILIISIITFLLVDPLSLDSKTLSTIIVIAATHTCLMVLFKTCKPFNTLRKVLCGTCYSLFLFCITVLPQFLEFRPLFSWAQYYSSNYTTEVVYSYPEIGKTKDSYYVINGKVTNLLKTPGTNSLIGCAPNADSVSGYVYTINGVATSTPVYIPEISYDNKGIIYLDGYRINDITYSDTIANALTVDENGYLYYQKDEVNTTLTRSDSYYNFSLIDPLNADYLDKKEVQYCIMPTIEIKGGELILNGVNNANAERPYSYRTSLSSLEGAEIKINPSTYELLINDEKIYATYNDGTIDTNSYKVSMPTISTDCNGNLYLGAKACGTDTTNKNNPLPITLKTIYGDIKDAQGNSVTTFTNIANGFGSYVDSENHSIDVSTIDVNPVGTNYQITGNSTLLTSELSLMGINLEVTVAGRIIINGYYTDYVSQTDTSKMTLMTNKQDYLVIDGITTNFRLQTNNLSTSEGGIVKILNATEKILLLMLCLLSAPLMKILTGSVPWIKKQIKYIQKMLSKF